jgi:O-antigen/teichoic acid export membrane protein
MSSEKHDALSLGGAAIASGVGTYVFLILAARGMSDVDYSTFAVFWSLSVVLGLGFYFPIEQETARELAGSPEEGVKRIFPKLVTATLVVTASVSAALLILLLPPFGGFMSPQLVLISILSLFAYAIQFPIRGVLSGFRMTRTYSGVVALEGLLRIAGPVVVLLAGASTPMAVALALVAATVLSVVPAVTLRRAYPTPRPDTRQADGTPVPFVRRAMRLVGAAVSIQLLLNSAVLIATGAAPEDSLLAGQLLACLSIARIPIFAYQVLQVLYLPRVAAHHFSGRLAEARNVILITLGLTAVAAVAVVALMTFAGGWVIGLLFGDSLVLDPEARFLVAAGVAIHMIAVVASDTAVAMGKHGLVMRSWMVGAAVGLLIIAVAPDALLSATLPLIGGALLAGIQLLIGIVKSGTSKDAPEQDGPRTAA